MDKMEINLEDNLKEYRGSLEKTALIKIPDRDAIFLLGEHLFKLVNETYDFSASYALKEVMDKLMLLTKKKK